MVKFGQNGMWLVGTSCICNDCVGLLIDCIGLLIYFRGESVDYIPTSATPLVPPTLINGVNCKSIHSSVQLGVSYVVFC